MGELRRRKDDELDALRAELAGVHKARVQEASSLSAAVQQQQLQAIASSGEVRREALARPALPSARRA